MMINSWSNSSYHNMDAILEAELERKHVLWLGNYISANDKAGLQSRNVKTVITVASELHPNYYNQIAHFKFEAFDYE